MITELSEEQLDELLAYTPHFTAENVENIKRRCLQIKVDNRKVDSRKIDNRKADSLKANSRRTNRRTLLTAAVVAAIITLSGIALAVSSGFDFGSFYNSMFNNPDADGIIEVGEAAVSNGLEITLLSAFVDRYTAYLTIEIKDIEGDRLTDSIKVLNESYSDGIHFITTGPVIYDETEKKATLALTVQYGQNISELGTAALSIDAIITGVIKTENEALEFDIAAHATDNESISLEQWHEMLGGGSGYSTSAGYDIIEKGGAPWEIGEPEPRPLKPGDMSAEIGGIDWAVVSNAGIADGFLHIQVKFIYENEHDMQSNKNIDKANFCIIDGTGNATGIYYQVNNSGYLDMMFEIDTDADLKDLTLALWGDQFIEDNAVRGSWNMNFAVDQSAQNRVLIAYPEESPVFSRLEVICSPVRVEIKMTVHDIVIDENGDIIRYVDGYELRTDTEKLDIQKEYIDEIVEYYQSFDKPFLTLDDGSVIAIENQNNSFDWLGGSVWVSTDYYDIESIRSITFCGEEYYFNGTP